LKITSSESYVNGIITDYTASVFNTVKSVFRFAAVTPGVQNYIFASNSPNCVSDNPDILSKRHEASGMSPAKLGLIFQSLYPKDSTNAFKNVLLHRREKVLNTDDTPISCLFYNKIIGWYSRSNISGILGFFESIKLSDIIFLVAAIFIMRLVFVFFKKNKSKPERFLKSHTLFAVFSSGLAGLSLELVILYIFQSNFGEIYHIVGLIIALFMFGLPLGAASARRAISIISPSSAGNNTRVVRLIIAVQIATGLIAALLPRIINLFLKFSFISQVSIFALTTLIGFLVGFIFPLSIHVFLGNKPHETGKTAGIIDAVDHIGAALGAFFIGTLFLPVFGVQNVCVFIALFPFMSAVLLLCDNR
jgi:spermidine synthase